MTTPRCRLVDAAYTPYYHCVSRCVRQAFLCGKDPVSGRSFEHRRGWIEQRLQTLAGLFAIDLCAYAVMSNHYHVVLNLNGRQQHWSNDEVIHRWGRLHRVPAWLATAEPEQREATVAEWRRRLGSLSWFMKSVNEPLARLANREDGCTGRFWQGRFGSQALLDDGALLRGMVYADLNPIRARLAATPEQSAYTAVRARIEARDQALAPMQDQATTGFRLPLPRADYLAIVDWSGRQLRHGKPGAIADDLPPILSRLKHVERQRWLLDVQHLSRRYFRAVGSHASLLKLRDQLGQQRLKGLVC